MTWLIAAMAVATGLVLLLTLWRLLLREVVRSHRRRHPASLTLLRWGYWTAAVALYGGVLLYALIEHPGPGSKLLVYGAFVYAIAAGAGYRLVMRLGYLVTDGEAYESEVRESEDRVVLRLTDQDGR